MPRPTPPPLGPETVHQFQRTVLSSGHLAGHAGESNGGGSGAGGAGRHRLLTEEGGGGPANCSQAEISRQVSAEPEPEPNLARSGGSEWHPTARLSTLQVNVAPAAALRSQLAAVIEADTSVADTSGALSPLPAAAAAAADDAGPGAQLPPDTFFLPAACLAAHVRGRLICEDGMRSLEGRGVINWAVGQGRLPEPDRLFPLTTASDGNCLLHAALLGMWGLHDHG
eukprot:SAG22_NODE_3461_length_1698_cov_1.911194_1_plen_225_part_10